MTETIKGFERNGDMYISEAVFGEFFDEESGKPALFQIFMDAFGLVKINVNSVILKGKSIAEIDGLLERTKTNLPRNLKEAIVHECGHAKMYYGKSVNEVQKMNKELSDVKIKGISKIAELDGAECIAEVEVLLHRGEQIPEEAMLLYKRYVTGGRE